MEEENFSNVINKFSEILKEKDINLNDYIDNTANNDNNNSNNNSCPENENIETNSFELDIDTILKIKTLISKINASNNNERISLLQALKPFLSENKQNKLDEYIKIVNIITIIESLNGEL